MRQVRPKRRSQLEEFTGRTLHTLPQYAAIIESSEDAIIISKDLNGTILTWNRGASAIYGYTAKEMIGRPMSLLVPPERRDEETMILSRIRAGQRVQHFETVRLRKGGIPIHVSVTISPLRQGDRIVGASHVARDISERKRLEMANAQLAAIVESSGDAIISMDTEGVIQTWNAGAEHVYGYSAFEAVGRSMTMLLPPREEEKEQILQRVLRGERVQEFEASRVRKDGSRIVVSLTISPIRDRTGAVIGASHVARDITQRSEFEQQMHQAQRLESLGVLAGGIAHDFNNLLTGILGGASLAFDSLPEDHPVRNLLTDVVRSAERAADLTRQLLAYAGKGRFVIEPVSISEVVAEVGALLRASIPRSVVLQFDLDYELPEIMADRSQIQQLIMNMVINAAEAIGEDRPGTVAVRTGAEEFGDEPARSGFAGMQIQPGPYVYFEVQDDGCGIAPETQEKIFDPFFTTKFTGRGLGLAAARGIVESHKGAIYVHSTPGRGTTFRVFLPVESEAAKRRLSGKGTILVVEDEEIIRKLAKTTLERDGYRVFVASNGKEAIEVFEHIADNARLVLLDLTMPVMSGEQTLRHLRQMRPNVPVILTSGHSEADAMRRFSGVHLAGFLQKPYSSGQLREGVEQALKRTTVSSQLTVERAEQASSEE